MCAPHSEASACFLPPDTIVDSGRILRRPIDEWASEVAARLRHFSAALDNAALIFVYAGQSSYAEGLCQSQLAWQGTFRGLFPAAPCAGLAELRVAVSQVPDVGEKALCA
jgi:hypothetical protein